MKRSFGLTKDLAGFVLTFFGAVVAIVGAVLAWPALVAVVFGGMNSGHGLGVVFLIPLGLGIAWLGNKLESK
jgi:hypothetical protein